MRRTLDEVYGLRQRTEGVETAGYVTSQEAANLYGAQAQQAALQAPGAAPLNVTGLSGLLSQPQKAYVPYVDALPDVLYDPMSQDGALVSFQGIVYWFDGRTEPGRWLPLGAIGVLVEDTHANRLALYPAGDYPLHCVCYETDRTVFYHNVLVGGVKTWVYLGGTMRATLANIPALGANDADFLFYATDYHHLFRWTGAAWEFGPCDDGSGFIRMDTQVPNAGLWQLCDGSTVARSNPDGTTTNVTLEDLVSAPAKAAYPKLGSPYTGVAVAAVAPTLAGADTDDEAAHTHSVTVPAEDTSDEAAHTHAVVGSTLAPTPTTPVSGPGAIQVGDGVHTHPMSFNSGVGTAHNHNVPQQVVASAAGSAHHHALSGVSVGADGEPRNLVLLPYFRR